MAGRAYLELVERVVSILEALAAGASSLGEIAAQTGLPKSTAFRVLFTLRELGWVEQAGRAGTYRLALRMLAVARQGTADPSLERVARPFLEGLRDELEESVWLGELRGRAVVLVGVAESGHRLRLSLGIGDRCPYHASAIGKAVAAFMPRAELEAVLGNGSLQRYTCRTITSRARLAGELARVRRQGFAVNDEETIEGAFLAAAPVFDVAGRAAAAISASAPIARCRPGKREQLAGGVCRAAADLTAELKKLGFSAARPVPSSAGPDAD